MNKPVVNEVRKREIGEVQTILRALHLILHCLEDNLTRILTRLPTVCLGIFRKLQGWCYHLLNIATLCLYLGNIYIR